MSMNEQDLCKKEVNRPVKAGKQKGNRFIHDFLNLNEQTIFHQKRKYYETRTETFGGVDFAERQMVAFIPDALYYEWAYPITYLEVTPTYPKFAEKLGHRDLLGSVMNLGVDRGRVGDILVGDDKYVIICEESIAPYFIEHLDKIKHTGCLRQELLRRGTRSISRSSRIKMVLITSNRL